MLEEAMNVMKQGKAQPTAAHWYNYPGGLFYQFWVTDADIRAGAQKLVNLAIEAMKKDYYVDKINHDIHEIQRLKAIDRRTRRVDQSGPSGNPLPLQPLLMPRYQPSLHFEYSSEMMDTMG